MTEAEAKEITPFAVTIFAAMIGAWTRPGAGEDSDGGVYLAKLRALAIKQAIELYVEIVGADFG